VVVFTVGAGTLSVARGATDDAGRASTRWTPGTAAGDQVVTATLRGTSTRVTHTVRVTTPTKRR